jgi:hypothetical protein
MPRREVFELSEEVRILREAVELCNVQDLLMTTKEQSEEVTVVEKT